jgi:hypothetical protein
MYKKRAVLWLLGAKYVGQKSRWLRYFEPGSSE